MNTEKYVLVIKEGHRGYFTERVIAESVDPYIGKALVEEWNNKNWRGDSECYLALVENDYVLSAMSKKTPISKIAKKF